MTQASYPWDGISVGDAVNAPYSAREWGHLWALLQGAGSLFPNYGILQGTGDGSYDPVQVIASGGSNVDVKPGAALVNGQIYETDAAVTLTVNANASGNPRIDTVILRADYTAQTIRPVLKQGTAAASPVAPTLTQNASIWESPLANIAVANGFASITQANITDRRRVARHSAAGWQPYAYPLSYIQGVDNSGTEAMNSLAVPFVLSGNMLIESITFEAPETASRTVTWGIYAQDLNEGDGDGNVRLLGGRLPGVGNTALTSDVPVTLPAVPAPVSVPPGAYWLVINGMTAFWYRLPFTTGLDIATNKALISGGGQAINQVIDLGSGWSKSVNHYPVRINGRVLGETILF